MKNQVLFPSKDISKKLKCLLLQFLFGAFVWVKEKSKKNCHQFTSNFLYYLETWYIIIAKSKMCHYVIFVKLQNFNTEDISV